MKKKKKKKCIHLVLTPRVYLYPDSLPNNNPYNVLMCTKTKKKQGDNLFHKTQIERKMQTCRKTNRKTTDRQTE